MQQLLLAVRPTFLPTFENFMVGDNGYAFSTIQQLAAGRALYVWGAPGSGRSHLLQASTRYSGSVYLHPRSTLEEFAEAREGNAQHIAIDDIEQCSTEQQAHIFYLYQVWRERQHSARAFSLLIAGNESPLHLESIREDLRTRLGWDLSVKLEALSDEQKITALHQLALSLGMPIGIDVLTWLLHHYERNMGALTQLIFELDRVTLERLKPITMPLLKDTLQHLSDSTDHRQLSLQGI